MTDVEEVSDLVGHVVEVVDGRDKGDCGYQVMIGLINDDLSLKLMEASHTYDSKIEDHYIESYVRKEYLQKRLDDGLITDHGEYVE